MNHKHGKDAPRPGLSDHVGRAFNWWLGELSAVVPNWLRATLSERPATVTCVLHDDGRIACALSSRGGILPGADLACEPGEALVARLAELTARVRRRTVRLSVPRDLALVRHSCLPARALPHAEAILRYDVENLMPLSAGEILADWFVDAQDGETGDLHITQVVLSRARIAALEDALGQGGFRITHLTVGDADGAPLPVDLVAIREPSLRRAFARLPPSARLLYAAALALLVSTPFLAAARQSQALEDLGTVSRLSPSAQAAAGVADFIETGGRRIPVVAVLDELTRRLPHGASLSDFRWSNGRVEVTLQGSDLGAAEVELSSSDLFRNVEATVEDRPTTDRLHLRFDIQSPARPDPAGDQT